MAVKRTIVLVFEEPCPDLEDLPDTIVIPAGATESITAVFTTLLEYGEIRDGRRELEHGLSQEETNGPA